MCLACFSSPAEFLNKWMVKGVKFLSRLLNASCSYVIYSPSIFLASSQTAPAHSSKMAARNTKRSISMILRKNRGPWTVYILVNVRHKSTLNAKIRVRTSPSILSAFISWWQAKKHLKRRFEGRHAGRQAEGINSGVVILGDHFLQDSMAGIDCCN